MTKLLRLLPLLALSLFTHQALAQTYGSAQGQITSPSQMSLNGVFLSGGLPSAATYLGYTAYTSDLGMVYSNGTAWAAVASRSFDVTTYGAKCNGTTDDAAAWNAAITAAKASANISGTPMTTQVKGCGIGQSLILSTLDFSGINSPVPTAFTVDMSGTCLLGQTNGTPVIDAMGSKMIRWVHLCIKGMSTLSPNVGIQWGRVSTAVPADQFYWDHPVVEGFFTFAAAYNQASEDNTYIAPRYTNATATGTNYGLVMDGYAFWTTSPNIKVTSTKQTLASSVTALSFIGETFIGGNIVSNNTTTAGAPIWMGQTSQHHYQGTYINSSGPYDVVLYCGTAASGGVNKNSVFDVHAEGASTTNTFLLTGAQVGACALYEFSYIDNQNFASASVLAIDSGSSVTSAILRNSTIHIDTLFATPTVFDTAANYTFSGSVYVPTSTPWNTPTGTPTPAFSGTLCFASRCDSYTNPTGAQNTAVGSNSLIGAAETGNFNSAFGVSTLASDGTGGNNTAIGYSALSANTSGGTNTAVGSLALNFNLSGAANTAVGQAALASITGNKLTGGSNTGIGFQALNAVQGAGASNTAAGANACSQVTSGTNNVCVGNGVASTTLQTGIGNILIGVDSTTDAAAAGTNDSLVIRGRSGGIAAIGGTGLNTAAPLITHPADVRTGTKFTVTGTGACSSTSTTVGGASTGSFLCTGTAGASTATITIAGATGNAAPTGWSCGASDASSGVAWATSGAASTTTATIAGTIATTSDRVVFNCTGY